MSKKYPDVARYEIWRNVPRPLVIDLQDKYSKDVFDFILNYILSILDLFGTDPFWFSIEDGNISIETKDGLMMGCFLENAFDDD